MAQRYTTLFDRLVANTKLSDPDDPDSCWLWQGHVSGPYSYPKVTIRVNGLPRSFWAHRLMLEEQLDVYFPFDEAAHICYTPRCINPNHLEIQTRSHNLSERRGHLPVKGGKSWIPVLFPRSTLDQSIEDAWENAGAAVAECPF